MKLSNQYVSLSVIALLGSISVPALADVTLNVGDNTIVTAINGQEVKNGMFTEPQRRFNLAAGKHVITAKYTRLYELRGDNHDILRSSNISLPVELADNQTYSLVMANQPDAYEQAKEYAKKPTLAVMAGTQVVASQQATAIESGGLLGGLGSALGGVFGGGNKAVQANQQTIAAIDGKAGTSGTAIAALEPAASPTANNTLDKFMQLWLQATPAEREKMRQWIAQ